jgi:hypothetical protein
MVKYYPNKEWIDACAIHARTDPVRFAEERDLIKHILIAVEDYQNSKLEKKPPIEEKLQTIRSSILDEPLKIVREPPSAYICGKIKNDGTVRLGDLVDLF